MVPEWPAPVQVRAVFTTRQGGHSRTPYDSFNLGDHVGDDATCVGLNRDELQLRIGARPVFMRQIHGTDVSCLGPDSPDGSVADAALTTHARIACTIMVADCLPVLLCSEDGTLVGALHAGWRGLASGVIQATVKAMRGVSPEPLMAWLGPCIGPRAFEVGEDVRSVFASSGWVGQDQMTTCFKDLSGLDAKPKKPKFLADLPALARHALEDCGVRRVYGNDGTNGWCTVSQASRFFSHRRDAALRGGDVHSTGRMAACIWIA
jgi:YfiH family protein